jgi:hypothetical protein
MRKGPSAGGIRRRGIAGVGRKRTPEWVEATGAAVTSQSRSRSLDQEVGSRHANLRSGLLFGAAG